MEKQEKGKSPGKPSPPFCSVGARKERFRRDGKIKITGDLRSRKPVHLIDVRQVYEMAKAMCSETEMASILGIRRDTFADAAEGSRKLAEAIALGYGETRHALRKVQLRLAMEGNPTLLLWLGKQYLGQKDKWEGETKTTVNVLVTNAMQELDNIPKDRLLEARAALRGQKETPPEGEVIENVTDAE